MNDNENLAIKEVNFLGDTLVAVKDNQSNIYVGVRWICNGIGLSEGQRKRQISNIQSDLVLSKGVSNLILPTNGGNQEVVCLLLDYIPLWLAKINITPTMMQENPNLVTKLIQYQLKCKDVLANAFLSQLNYQYKLPTNYIEALEQLVVAEKEKEQLKIENKQQQEKIKQDASKVSYYDMILKNKSLLSTTQIAKDYGMSARKFNEILYKLKIQFKQSGQWVLYSNYQNKGYVSSYTFTFDDNKSKLMTKWTQKGRIFLYNFLKENKILPTIEQEVLNF